MRLARFAMILVYAALILTAVSHRAPLKAQVQNQTPASAQAQPQTPAPPPPPSAMPVVRLDPALDGLIAPDAKLEVVKDGFGFTEGTNWVQRGETRLLGFCRYSRKRDLQDDRRWHRLGFDRQ